MQPKNTFFLIIPISARKMCCYSVMHIKIAC
uniref:Uncharacterized protein n=1 Tax=Anguilla anguilla TaxID=7936 RepID=A0A0E9R5Y8_ANGAN